MGIVYSVYGVYSLYSMYGMYHLYGVYTMCIDMLCINVHVYIQQSLY